MPELGKSVFDGVEIRAIRWKIFEVGTNAFIHFANPWSFVAGEIVHHDHIAGPQLGQQYLLDVGLEGKAVDRSVDDEGRGEPAYRQRPDEGCGFSVAAVRDADLQAFAFEASVVAARHVGGSPGLVDKDETFRIKI